MNRGSRKTKKPPVRYYTYDMHGEVIELDAPVPPRAPPVQAALFAPREERLQ